MADIKVLLVDDEKELVDTLVTRLEKRGFTMSSASNGEEALLKLKDHEQDVIILDVFMPGKDGIEVLKEIKSFKPLVEVVMLSGHADLGLAIKGMQYGAFDFLTKPADIVDLVEKINKAYARKIDHAERIRKANFVKDRALTAPDKHEKTAEKPMSAENLPPDSGRLLVIGRESDFPQELMEYALEISKRMSYSIIALNVAGFDNESFKIFPAARERVYQDFKDISEKNAGMFMQLAKKDGIAFCHMVKSCERDDAIDIAIKEIGKIDYVVSESEDEQTKGQIFAYCPM
ncbi:response regulator [Elusimicrobiota bacterium]